jgi:hypothetical protein
MDGRSRPGCHPIQLLVGKRPLCTPLDSPHFAATALTLYSAALLLSDCLSQSVNGWRKRLIHLLAKLEIQVRTRDSEEVPHSLLLGTAASSYLQVHSVSFAERAH